MPTIQENALIVVFNASVFNPKKTDIRATREVVEKYEAHDAGKFVKAILPESAVSDIAKIVSAARQYHYCNSLPWLQDGGRIIPVGHYPTYSTHMAAFKERFDAAVSVFCTNYLSAIELARARLKGLFDQADYPAAEAVRGKFRFNVVSLPIPSSSDFRISGLSAEVRQQVDASVAETVTAGINEVTGRVRECLQKIVERLQNPENTFRNSLISNLEEINRLIPVFNITDSRVLHVLNESIAPLARLDPELLRQNVAARAEACAKAKEILSTYLVDENEEI